MQTLTEWDESGKIKMSQVYNRKGGMNLGKEGQRQMADKGERIIVVKTQEEVRAEDLERLENFRWIDDTFARTAFKDRPEIAQFVLRIITGIEDLVIDPITFKTQYDAKRLAGSRSVIFDAKGGDTKGRKYDLEMEKQDASPKRMEYHMATLLVESLHEGDEFSDLKESYVIFVCDHDEVGNRRAVNSFSYRNDDLFLTSEEIEESKELHASLGGVTHILSVNGDFEDAESEIGKLIHDFKCKKADEMYFPNLAARTRELKETKEGRDTMCMAMEKERTRTLEEGNLISLLTLMETQNWNAQQAMNALRIPLADQPMYERSVDYAMLRRNATVAAN